MIFHGIQKKRPHKRAAHVIVTIIQFYKTLFFTPQKMDLESNTYGESVAAVRIILKFDGIVAQREFQSRMLVQENSRAGSKGKSTLADCFAQSGG